MSPNERATTLLGVILFLATGCAQLGIEGPNTSSTPSASPASGATAAPASSGGQSGSTGPSVASSGATSGPVSEDRADELGRALNDFTREHADLLAELERGKNGEAGGYLPISHTYEMTDLRRRQTVEAIQEWTQEQRAALAGPFAQMAANCPELRATGRTIRNRSTTEWCDLIENRDAYFEAYIATNVQAEIESELETLEAWVERIQTEGKVYQSEVDLLGGDEVSAGDAGIILEGTGGTVPASLTAQLATYREQFQEAMREGAGENRFPASLARHRDRAVENKLRSVARERGWRYVRAGVVDAAWDVETNALGIPQERTKDSVLVVQVPGESFCRIYDIKAVEEHEGGGRYGRTMVYTSGFNRFLVSRCR